MGCTAVILEAAKQSIQGGGAADTNVHEVVVSPRDVNGVSDLRNSLGPGEKCLRVARRIEPYVDERLQSLCRIGCVRTENRAVSDDHSDLLESTHASRCRVRAQADPATDLAERCPTIYAQNIDDFVVYGIHAVNYLRRLTDRTARSTARIHSRAVNIFFSLMSGAVAGLALAAPLGAIGVLLIQEGVTRGLRRGMPGAAAVATVDILYCTAAVTAGAVAGPIVGGWEPWPQIVGGSALLAIGARGLLKSQGTRGFDVERGVTRSGTSRRRYVLFLGLTALNPATLVYFTALLAGLDQVTETPAAAVSFIAGVGIASFGWQALLVVLGAGLRQKAAPSFHRWTAIVGNGLVALLGIALIARAV